MKNNTTFGEFLVKKRLEHNLSARQLAIALDYSPVYICDIEKGRKPVPDEILEQLPRLLLLDEAETNEMYDLAAKSRNTISADLPADCHPKRPPVPYYPASVSHIIRPAINHYSTVLLT